MVPGQPPSQAGAMELATPQPTPAGPTDAGSADPAPRPSGGLEERLHRCRDGRMVAGVAAGLADYFDIDVTLVRIGFALVALLGGLAVPLYLAGWLLIPEEGVDHSVAEDLLDREWSR
jgi:phage shock protein C